MPVHARADIIVHDMIALAGREVMLKTETKGILFNQGGEVVEFFVDGKSLGKNLSGGDGVAFKRFVPLRTGLYKIRVQSAGATDNGILLTVKRSTKLVFIDIEGSLWEKPFIARAVSGGAATVKKISSEYTVIYLRTSMISMKSLKLWLKENGFPEAPVLSWRQGEVFREIREKNLRIKAIVGRPDVLKSAKMDKALLFSFDSTEDAEEARDWEEIVKKIRRKE